MRTSEPQNIFHHLFSIPAWPQKHFHHLFRGSSALQNSFHRSILGSHPTPRLIHTRLHLPHNIRAIVAYRPVAVQQADKQTPVSTQRSRYCWTITMETMFSMWSVTRWYKQDSLKQWVLWSCQQFSWVKWREVAGWWVREFSWQFSWKSACEEKIRRLVSSVVSSQQFYVGGFDKRTWAGEAMKAMNLPR
jgi:hypothetical protein